MRIDKINIQNFRCFKSYEVALAQGTTVFIGKNGTGKTNLLYALKQGMSFIFSKNKNNEQNTLSSSNDLHLTKFEPMDANYDSFNRSFIYPIELKYTGTLENQFIEWAFIKNSAGGTILSLPFQIALTEFLEHYNKPQTNLPLLAFFSDSYPHKKINISKNAKAISTMDVPPRGFGYYQWGEESNCAEIWQNRYIKTYQQIYDMKKDIEPVEAYISQLEEFVFRNELTEEDYTSLDEDKIQEKEVKSKKNIFELEKAILIEKAKIENLQKEKTTLEIETNFIDNRLKLFTAPLRQDLNFINKDFDIKQIRVDRPKGLEQYQLLFVFADNKRIYFDSLPQGYKRLISIVFDIAYRSYILNKDAEPVGIVIIDEVELHLHPSLQQEVLERFRKTFPLVQFIVSTHSPLVISNLKANDEYGTNKIIKLTNTDGVYDKTEIENIYGVDYITSLMEIMDTQYRPSTIDSLIDAHIMYKARKKETEAQKILDELLVIVGKNNEYIKKEIDKRFIESL